MDNKVVLIGTSPITFNVLEGKGKYVFDTLIIQTSMEVIKMVKPLESKKTPEMNLKVEMTENQYFVLCYMTLIQNVSDSLNNRILTVVLTVEHTFESASAQKDPFPAAVVIELMQVQ